MTRANRFFALVTIILVAVSSSAVGSAAVIFENNFDGSPDTHTGSTVPPGWEDWYQSGGVQGTIGGVTHYSGEISAPGRGVAGKSLKMWRGENFFEDYTGALYAGLTENWNPSSQDFYIRWTMKLSSATAWDFSGAGATYQKLFRLNTDAGSGEFYVGMNVPYANQTFPAGAALQVAPFLHTDPVLGYQSSNYTVLLPADMAPLFDDQWHSYEIHADTTADTIECWVDGVLKHHNSNLPMVAQRPIFIQHFGMGNRASGVVLQSTWQPWEFDDLVIADTYIGPLAGGGDITAPSAPSGLAVQ